MPRALTIEEKRARNMEPKESTSEEKGGRKRRGVFNGTQSKYNVDVSKLIANGYHPHIFNDDRGRVEAAIENGYEFVSPEEVGRIQNNVTSANTDLSNRVRFLAGVKEDGTPMYAYLMKIKQEWFDEDQQAIQDRVNKTEAAIKKGKVGNISTEGFYDAGIKIDQK